MKQVGKLEGLFESNGYPLAVAAPDSRASGSFDLRFLEFFGIFQVGCKQKDKKQQARA